MPVLLGVVYYANYFRWFSRAREDWFSHHHGGEQPTDLGNVVVRIEKARYNAAAKLGDLVVRPLPLDPCLCNGMLSAASPTAWHLPDNMVRGGYSCRWT